MEITINTSNKEDVRKAIEILKGFLDETTNFNNESTDINEPIIPSLDVLSPKKEEINIKQENNTTLNSMIDESKEEENELNFNNGITTY